MNIKEAKEQIKNAMTAYFTKDETGGYAIPVEKQRPVFLMGPPGIGKTAIMEQVASEMGVGLLSYSMTHHTRQSALGLPFIVHKNYGGKEYDVSEYTMSEIISAVYDLMENTGVKEGILFLDEINCVSETLAPIMLQFLQYKVFGRHRVPDGWIIVTAGNPPEYNNSVREFDIVTWDRLKRIDIEPDFTAWKEYAYKAGVHASVLTYLEIKKADFYRIESTVDGKSFVTARGWEDLSQMITLYEKNNIKVDIKLIRQYIQHDMTARSFAAYYDLFNKYRSDYQIDEILSGNASDSIKDRAENAKFDERLSLLGLILDSVTASAKQVTDGEDMLRETLVTLKEFKLRTHDSDISAEKLMNELIAVKKNELENGKQSSSISVSRQKTLARAISQLENMTALTVGKDGKTAFADIRSRYDSLVSELKISAKTARDKMSNAFIFCNEVYTDGQEMLILVTELPQTATRQDLFPSLDVRSITSITRLCCLSTEARKLCRDSRSSGRYKLNCAALHFINKHTFSTSRNAALMGGIDPIILLVIWQLCVISCQCLCRVLAVLYKPYLINVKQDTSAMSLEGRKAYYLKMRIYLGAVVHKFKRFAVKRGTFISFQPVGLHLSSTI